MRTSDSDPELLLHHLRTNVPREMQKVRRWVFAIDKVPFNADAPEEKADVTDPSTWSSFEYAAAVAEERGGHAGFVLGDGFVGVDLDDCRDRETGEITPYATDVIRTLDSYCESSVSGTGVHIICRGTLPAGRRRHGTTELYDRNRYFVVTGNRISGTFAERHTELHQLHSEVFPSVAATPPESGPRYAELSDESIVERINDSSNAKLQCLWHGDWTGYRSRSEADLALCRFLTALTQNQAQMRRVLALSGLKRPKWDRTGYLSTTISNACNNVSLKGISPMLAPNNQTKQSRPDAEALVKLVESVQPDLFCSSDHDPHITMTIGSRVTTMRIGASDFRDAIFNLCRERRGCVPAGAAVTEAVSVLNAMARRNPAREIYVRVAREGASVWLDLGRTDGSVIHATGTGWSVTRDSRIKFRRSKGMQSLPIPVSSSNSLTDLLQRLLNISTHDDAVLVAGWLLSALRGAKSYPILCLNGEQGSAKSSATTTLRRIIDPHVVSLAGFPKSDRDLMIRAKNSHVLAFDNISHLPNWLSDALSTIATGAGYSTRQLHTDDSEMLFSGSRPVVMNGIPDFINRDDLISRTMVVTLKPISPEHRKKESEIEELFEQLHPVILGKVLDGVVAALANERQTTVVDRPRLADVATWVTAAEPTIGLAQGLFVKCLNQNQRQSIANNLDGDIVVETIESLGLPWTGTMKQLRNEIRECEQKPGTPRALSNALKQKQATLRQMGITYESQRINGKTVFTIRRAGNVLAFPTAGKPEELDIDLLVGECT